MIQMGTILDVADNTGAKKIACITVLGGSTGDYGHLGDVISASVKEAAPDGTDKKGAKVKAVIVRTVRAHRPHPGGGLQLSRRLVETEGEELLRELLLLRLQLVDGLVAKLLCRCFRLCHRLRAFSIACD
jgi:large subunit ribosomal protein L14